jgi:hypothetical protein
MRSASNRSPALAFFASAIVLCLGRPRADREVCARRLAVCVVVCAVTAMKLDRVLPAMQCNAMKLCPVNSS